jgi:hypothetical protein
MVKKKSVRRGEGGNVALPYAHREEVTGNRDCQEKETGELDDRSVTLMTQKETRDFDGKEEEASDLVDRPSNLMIERERPSNSTT